MMKRSNGSSRSKICSEDGISTDRYHLVRERIHRTWSGDIPPAESLNFSAKGAIQPPWCG
jgi:hypothetical protein